MKMLEQVRRRIVLISYYVGEIDDFVAWEGKFF